MRAGSVGPPEDPRVYLTEVIELSRGNARRRPGLLSGDLTVGRGEIFQRPYAVAWYGDDLLVSDPGAGRVARIGARGKVVFSEPQLFDTPMGLTVCPAGILVTDATQGNVVLLGPDLERISTLAENLIRPTGIACRGGRIYVVETGRHRVLVFEGNGEPAVLGTRGSRTGQFNYPTAATVYGESSEPRLLVGDAMNFRIQELDAHDGSFLRQFGRLGDAPGEMPRIKGVVADAGRRIWVSDGHLDQVSLYDQEGRLLISIGKTGSAPGEFSFPAGMAAHADGRVAVIDSYNKRIQILRVGDSR